RDPIPAEDENSAEDAGRSRVVFSPRGTKAQTHDFPPSSPAYTSENTRKPQPRYFPPPISPSIHQFGSASALAHCLAKDWGIFMLEAILPRLTERNQVPVP